MDIRKRNGVGMVFTRTMFGIALLVVAMVRRCVIVVVMSDFQHAQPNVVVNRPGPDKQRENGKDAHKGAVLSRNHRANESTLPDD